MVRREIRQAIRSDFVFSPAVPMKRPKNKHGWMMCLSLGCSRRALVMAFIAGIGTVCSAESWPHKADAFASEPGEDQSRPGVRGGDEPGTASGLPVPRFVTLKSAPVNLRRGPSFKHPIDWVFLRKGWPMEIISEYGPWRQVRDIEGTTGWVHQRLLDGARAVLVAPNAADGTFRPVYRFPAAKGQPVALAESGAILRLATCAQGWCEVRSQGVDGYIRATDLWGVYRSER
jgi:SH3-like domain-containing protein